ncbi:MAG: hypothetical protein ACUVQ0_02085 [Thermoproteota archaeon]
MVEVIKVEVSKALVRKFRKRAMELYGYKKGAIKEAIEELLKRFIVSEEVDWNALKGVLKYLGLNVYDTSMEDELATSMLMGRIKLDFDECLQYYVGKKLGVEAIVSYDKHFDSLDIKRREPSVFL